MFRRQKAQNTPAKQWIAFDAEANYWATVATHEMSEGEAAPVEAGEKVVGCADCAYHYSSAVVERDANRHCASGEQLIAKMVLVALAIGLRGAKQV